MDRACGVPLQLAGERPHDVNTGSATVGDMRFNAVQDPPCATGVSCLALGLHLPFVARDMSLLPALQVDLTALLITVAVGTYVLGFLFRNQIYIRLLVFIGSIAYGAYYWVVGPEPLWDAIIGVGLIAAASLQGMLRLWWSRQPGTIPHDLRPVWERMGHIEPGLFKQLLKSGSRTRTCTALILTREGEPSDKLWFFIDGRLTIERSGQPAMCLGGCGFVGEIAWMTRGAASATVTAAPGTELIEWSAQDLRRATRRNHRLEMALEAVIAQDLARKLSSSNPIGSAHVPADAGT